MKDLFKEVLEAYNSVENRKKIENTSNAKIIVGMGRSLLSDVLGFSISDYFKDPSICLDSQLKWKLFLHNEINDDTPLDLLVGIDYSTALEPSLFGQEAVFSKRSDPTYGECIIKQCCDIKNLESVDFFKSGIMPEVHRMYEALGNLKNDDFKLFFPGWARGPWSIATIIRGFNDLFFDIIDKPEFVHEIMNKIVNARISFENQRCKFLKINPEDRNYKWKYIVYRNNTSSDQFEDEVDGNLFSKETFNNFILPYSRKLSEYYKGTYYYHSCGNLTQFIDKFDKKLNLEYMIHISPFTDISKVIEYLPEKVILQRSLNPLTDVMMADEEKMRNSISKIIRQSRGRKIEIWADALYEGGWNTVNQVKKLVKVFRELVAADGRS